jgi:hypothetical protein
MGSADTGKTGAAAKAGAGLFLLWSILHIWVGFEGIHQFVGGNVGSFWGMLAGGENAPRNLVQIPADPVTVKVHLYTLLNFTVDVGGYGVLGLVVAWLIWKQASWLGYLIGLVIIGICDLTFTFAMLLSGVIEPSLPTISGPVIWLMAVIATPFGLPSLKGVPRR